MSRSRILRLGLLAAWAAYAWWAVAGVSRVPFHPDESTYLYMSRDFDLLFRQGQPAEVVWDAAGLPAAVQRYRLLDAPMIRYLAGLGRWLFAEGAGPLPVDWDWSADWAANAANGAVPDARLLWAGRALPALLTALAPLLLFALGHRLGGLAVGGLAAALLAGNSLVLLHGRRAMSEGPLLFCLLLAMLIAVATRRKNTHHWQQAMLTGAAGALALAAKLTGLAVLPGLALGLLWPQAPLAGRAWLPRLRRLGLALLAFAGAALALHPALWSQPAQGLAAMAQARRALVQSSTGLARELAPQVVLGGPGQRLAAATFQVFFAPLMFWEVPNYAAATRAAEASYLADPLHRLGRSQEPAAALAAGTAGLGLALAGLALAARQALANPAQRPTVAVLLAWTAAAWASALAFNMPWQRYYLPLVPVACLWAAHGLASLLRLAAGLAHRLPSRASNPASATPAALAPGGEQG